MKRLLGVMGTAAVLSFYSDPGQFRAPQPGECGYCAQESFLERFMCELERLIICGWS